MAASPVEPALTRWLDAFVSAVARVGGWAVVVLTVITVFDVVSRRFFVVGSVALQELEWHFHSILIFTAIGHAYLRGAHIRIDLFSRNFGDRGRLAIEIAGYFFFVAPFCLILIVTGTDYAFVSYSMGEGSSSRSGIPHRWVVKTGIPICALLLLMAATARLVSCWAALRHGLVEDGIALLDRGTVRGPTERGTY